MKSVALSDAKAKLSGLVDEVRTGGEPIVIRKREKDVVVLVEINRFRHLQELEDEVISLKLRQALKGRKYELREVLDGLDLDL